MTKEQLQAIIDACDRPTPVSRLLEPATVKEMATMAIRFLEPAPLQDGPFSCVSAFAVKVAHLMNCAQACYDEDSTGVTEVLEDYLRGTKDEDECIATFYAEWPKVFAGARHD